MHNMLDADLSVVKKLWQHFGKAEWDEARDLLHPAFNARWPQSNELLPSADTFIEVNRTYPGTHEIRICNVSGYFDEATCVSKVTSEVEIKTVLPDGKVMELFAVSLFTLQYGLLLEATEYWADRYPAPTWRAHLVQSIVI